MPLDAGARRATTLLRLTRYERRISAASRSDLRNWAILGGIAAPVVYTAIAGWPPTRPGLFGLGLALVFTWLVLVPPIEDQALRYRKLGVESGITLRHVLLLRLLSLAIRASIVGILVLQGATSSSYVLVKALVLTICDDPIKRYVDSRILHDLLVTYGGIEQAAER
ncbi:MAG TPA: hypothetical protein VNL71_21255 [Chloroflexota bacterium]|nr:hypothetical protein [Chloroflexota bacterium]